MTASVAVTDPRIRVKTVAGLVIRQDASVAHGIASHLQSLGEEVNPRELAESEVDPWCMDWPCVAEPPEMFLTGISEVRYAILNSIRDSICRIEFYSDSLAFALYQVAAETLRYGLHLFIGVSALSSHKRPRKTSQVDWRSPPQQLHQGREASFNALEAPAAPLYKSELAWHGQVVSICHSNITDLEIPSIELCAKSVWDFPEMPWDFVLDMSRQCWDEARHTMAFYKRLRDFGGELGCYSAKNELWEAAAHEGLGLRLTIHQRIGECTGVDGALFFSRRALTAGDEVSASMFEFIARDEINHVRIGTKWSEWLGNDPETDPLLTQAQRVRCNRGKVDSGPLTFPLSEVVCEQTGVRGKQLDQLRQRWTTFGSKFVDSSGS